MALFFFVCASFALPALAIGLPELWDGRATLQFVSKARFSTFANDSLYPMNVGFDFVARGTQWFLFHREYGFAAAPSFCKADYARIVVRTSTNRGITWSEKTVIVEPQTPGPDECAIVDGAAHFDEGSGTWHYLGQCLARDNVWRMCHYFLRSAQPSTAFSRNGHNPVVNGGQLWGPICSGSGKHCSATNTHDEGTPDIVSVDAQRNIYVTFHGWDPVDDRSFRGVARTRDFVSWETSGAGLPGDAMFASQDCDPWNVTWDSKSKCVGGGEGSIHLAEDGFMYQLIEAPDISLGCYTTPGKQNWVLGLLRSSTFAPTGQWEQLPAQSGNPAVVPTVKQGCYIQYHRLFADSIATYLEYWADNWMQVFEIVPGNPQIPFVAGPPPQ
eukprot:TRINITY_DN4698_c0_g1_i2.p1 TRINITY_DN4698_c0_g1~~TRINITY_DN4698_c0_g1_i2.p1  ORF type:complete len:385 (+),score=32.69 TRINITY_DN4698_c0_g1_i2:22-1176(+)